MAWLPVGALAQGNVAKPIHIIVPFGPGGVADLTVRTVGQKLAEILNQPVIIYNKQHKYFRPKPEELMRVTSNSYYHM